MKMVSVPAELLERLVDIVYDSFPKSTAADEGQAILDQANKKPQVMDEGFLKEMIASERSRGTEIVSNYVKELEAKDE